MSKGDLVWIPSNITLMQFLGEGTEVARFTKLEKPNNVLLIDRGSAYCEVFYEGEHWYALNADVYEAK